MSDSDLSDYSDCESNSTLNKAINSCLKMKPDHVISNKSKYKSIKDMKSSLSSCNENSSKQRSSSRIDNRKNVEDCFCDMSLDFNKLSKKFDSVFECLTGILDQMEEMESRIIKLEEAKNSPTVSENPVSYASVLNTTTAVQRLDKLEYLSSEKDRMTKLLEVTLTHPDINLNAPNLVNHVQEFMSDNMKMERRSIDVNLQVKKTARTNTVLILFSHRRFKAFVYAAKKRLNQDNDRNVSNLYLNENLTSYNFHLLMTLKRERKRRSEECIPNFETVYSFEGKIFTKKKRTDPNDNAVHIKNPSDLNKFLQILVSVPSVSTMNDVGT